MADSQSRKYQLTINNPAEKGFTHEAIKAVLGDMKSVTYYCISDEIGLKQQTPHTHVFLFAKSPVRFSRIKKLFPEAHIEQAHGSCEENRSYIAKIGKWENDDKHGTQIPGTFEEWGEMPPELGQGFRSDVVQMYELIKDGLSNAEIMAENPELAAHISRMDKIRQDILEARYKDDWRNLSVTYIWGETATGKTRSVMDKHGYSNVYRVTDYNHPFDRYASQPVLLLDEFRSSLMIGDMLDYLDGYPLALPARYANRQACYTAVYIISNIDLTDQYFNVQATEPATWAAFLRRIHKVVKYFKDGHTAEYTTDEYLHGLVEIEDDGDLPFDDTPPEKPLEYHQTKIK
ncbi:hypothetical protein [Oscillibacter sp.]|uniref:hypothetical protein n=1 Tax=Oscillibacter sp. TaxID=1945593 RepID=UPI0033946376